mgnify:FL=1
MILDLKPMQSRAKVKSKRAERTSDVEDDITNKVVEDKTDNPHTRIQRTRSRIFKAYGNLGYLRNISFLTIKIFITSVGYPSLIQLLTAK